ncbi:four and a half LIM domains protein 5 isoform X2 [Athene cunicularia]|uniref:Four and a half LIM domains protein 5 n=2 Tax=Athene cunicularia TaxID=194338 RepID=A0A663LQR2_ATHCN|nr:four and a half LIM domains protein 5 isoform X2 [Athene cunicularia]XP_026702056.1 four and a half LIM domains protein 5 isoform X2 [Athene cunicularia]
MENPTRMTSNHTDCHYCLQSLRGRKYALREENAYCVTCYESLFANPCEECKKPIECDSKDLAYKGRHWHEGCFKCAKCSRSLVEKPFAAKDEVLLCTECYSDEYSSKCFHCQKTIMPGSRKMEFKGSSWHESCFVCQYCRQPLGTKPLITKDNENYCVPCFEKQFAHHCYSCKKVITSGGVTYHDQPWHKECFVCAGCKTQLSGQRFISKDEDPYCVDCFSKLYAKKCAACKKPITALGGAKFISFEERQWHGECFNCVKCSVSLVGQGFLTRQDDVLCHECGFAS